MVVGGAGLVVGGASVVVGGAGVVVGGVMPAFVDLPQEAQKNGLHITAHAGESGPAANVKLVCLCGGWGGGCICTFMRELGLGLGQVR